MLGQIIGHFKILEKIGEGGMGIVYKAKDTKLDREVALKFLPPATLRTAAEKERFLREARAAAALNHPNIAHIYAIEEVDGQMFIAMEYIDGENLHDMITKSGGAPLPLAKAIDFIVQIAQGLRAAHDQDIVHRDVKSANIMVTKKGAVKIMDFGLAKLANKSLLTQEGTTLGTVSYMSPEQAGGKSVDHRSDIWSIGIILYEILSGKLPFSGDYEQAVIYNILNSEAEPLTGLRSGLPIAIDGIVAKCLAKDPDRRYQHVDEIPSDLRALQDNQLSLSRIVTGTEKSSYKPVEKKKLWAERKFQTVLWLFLVLLSISITYFLTAAKTAGTDRSYRFEIFLPGRIRSSVVALSPDGKSCAYAATGENGQKQLNYSRFDLFLTTVLTSGENTYSPFFSPDGNWIGYFNGYALKKVSILGGTPILVCEARGSGTADWSEKLGIIFSTGRAIVRIEPVGGITDTILTVEPNSRAVEYRNPVDLPDRNAILYSVRVQRGWNTAVLDIKTGEKFDLLENAVAAKFIPEGYIVYQDWNDEDLFVVPFDIDRLKISGPAQRVVDRVRSIRSSESDYNFSSGGALIYTEQSTVNGGEVCLVDKKGIISPLPDLKGIYTQPRFSPDGKKLVLRKIGTHCQLWIYDIERGTLSLLTMEGDNHDPLWTADGRYIICHRAEYGVTSIYWQRADGSQGAQLLTKSNGVNPRLTHFAAGSRLFFNEDTPSTGSDVFMYDLKEKSKTPILQEKYDEGNASLSPDGRWLAYTSDESGTEEIYLRPLANQGPKILVSKGGGNDAHWAPDGQSLYYTFEDKMMCVPVSYHPEISVSTPEELFAGNFYSAQVQNYDISPDGERFVMIYNKIEKRNSEISRIVLNWFDELRSLTAR